MFGAVQAGSLSLAREGLMGFGSFRPPGSQCNGPESQA